MVLMYTSELNYKVGRDNQKAIKRVEESQIRIEEGQENLKRALTWVGRNQARLEKRQAAAEKRQAAAEKKMEDIGRTVVASLRNGLADPPSYDEAMRDSDVCYP